ncbi:MAG: sugar tyrosine-protein kinase [Rariglobus sp.]|jgi:hypothetical protein|nr:sugar tyrosine-protein kinase [Rariglobus sp.]
MKRRTFNLTVFCGTMAVLLGAVAGYAFLQPRLYQSAGRLLVGEGISIDESIEMAQSQEVLRRVAERVRKDEDLGFLNAYGLGNPASVTEIERLLIRDHVMTLNREARTIDVGYRHPNREVASRVAWYFSDEILAGEARRKIEEQMRIVDALVEVAKQQERKIEKIQLALVVYQEASETERRSSGEAERKLKADLLIEQQALEALIQRARASTMVGGFGVVPRYQFVGKPRPAWKDAYLREPIILNLARSVLGAGILSMGLGFVFKRPEDQPDRVRVWLRAIREGVRRPIGRREVFVFATVLLVGGTLAVMHALVQPRIYQSSVTVAVSESAKDYGWDTLSVSDLHGWLPVITQQVSRQFTRRPYAGPFLGLRMAGDDADWRVVDDRIHGNLQITVLPKSDTLTLSFRHEDFKVAGDVVDAFGRAYEAYPLRWESRNPEAMRRRMGKIKNPKLGLQPPPVRVVASGWATTGDYLRLPMIIRMGVGCALAAVCGVLAVIARRLVSLLAADCARRWKRGA